VLDSLPLLDAAAPALHAVGLLLCRQCHTRKSNELYLIVLKPNGLLHVCSVQRNQVETKRILKVRRSNDMDAADGPSTSPERTTTDDLHLRAAGKDGHPTLLSAPFSTGLAVMPQWLIVSQPASPRPCRETGMEGLSRRYNNPVTTLANYGSRHVAKVVQPRILRVSAPE
jgi:hypothetical protein